MKPLADMAYDKINGFRVSEKTEIKDGFCFMGLAPYKSFYSMIGSELYTTWVDSLDYKHLLDKMKTGEDPEVLVVNGIIYKKGTVQTLEWFRADNGTLSDIIPWNYSIKILDDYGNLLTEIWFDATFPVVNGIELDFTGFAFAVPYPEETGMF